MTDFNLLIEPGEVDYNYTSLFDDGELPLFKSTLALTAGDVSFHLALFKTPYFQVGPGQDYSFLDVRKRSHEHICVVPVDGIETNTEQFTYCFLFNNNKIGSKSFCHVLNGTGGTSTEEFIVDPVETTGSFGPFTNFSALGEYLFFDEIDPSYRKSDGTYYDVCIVYIAYPDNAAVNPDAYGDVITPSYENFTGFEPYLRPDLQSFASFYDPPPERWSGAILGPKTGNSQDKHIVTLYSGSLYPAYYDFTNNVMPIGVPTYFSLSLADIGVSNINYINITTCKLMIISTQPNPTKLPYN
jgi:hypothetical protein